MSSPLSDQEIRPSLTDDDLSRILDNLRLIEEQKNGHTCSIRRGMVHPDASDRSTAKMILPVTEPCGKPATHEAIITCCIPRSRYLCAEHVTTIGDRAITCPRCNHRCLPGVCAHQIITPL